MAALGLSVGSEPYTVDPPPPGILGGVGVIGAGGLGGLTYGELKLHFQLHVRMYRITSSCFIHYRVNKRYSCRNYSPCCFG